MLGKNKGKIKLFAGEHFYLQEIAGGSPPWLDMGELANDVKILDDTTAQEIVNNAGDAFDISGRRKVTLDIPLQQTGKDEWDFITDDSRGKTYKGYYYNGIVGGQYDEFFFAEAGVIPTVNHDTSGKPMIYVMKLSLRVQSSIVSGLHTDLPSVKKAIASFTGKNKFYARINTTA